MRDRHRPSMIIAAVAALGLLAAACGGSSTSSPDGSASGSSSDVSGEIFISGSSTVEPISVRVAELFEDVAPDVVVDVEGPGTGDGFKRFCDGETDISDASRAIKDAEKQTCAANGITDIIELRIGIDGIAVMTNEANDAVECLTFVDLYALVGPEAEGTSTWAEAAARIPGTSDLPDAPLDIFGPGEESGTYDSFVEIVLEKIAEERGQEATTRTDYNPSADDNVILQGVQSGDTTLGWVGFAFADQASGVKLLDVDGGDGCVPATPETIASGEYPIARPLFIYVNAAKLADNPALEAFVDFYMGAGLDEAVAEVDYVELDDAAKAETRARWDARETITVG